MAVAVVKYIATPLCRRIFARLTYWKENGPFLKHVSSIRYGPATEQGIVGMPPVSLAVAVFPGPTAGATQGYTTSNTTYRDSCVVYVEGAEISAPDNYDNFADTIDDLRKLICEVEQKTGWNSLSGTPTYGESISPLSNESFTVDYPTLKVGEASYHFFGVVRWEIPSHIAWE